MHWFFIALISPIFYSLANHTDKYLISKYLKNGEVGSLIIFSAIFSVVALPIILIINPLIFEISLGQGIILGINGMLLVFATLFYFYALHEDEATYVIPFYQTIPIFAFILGYFILGETITKTQGVASLIIIMGTLILSFDLGINKIKFKKKVVILMLFASLFFAINGTIFKLIAIEEGFWPSTFWGLIGKIILGLIFLFFVPSYQKQFLSMIKENKFTVLGLNSMSELFFIIAEASTGYAILLAPIALVLLVNAFQPFFVFIIGILLTVFLPKISKESLNKNALIQKICGIGLIITGTLFLDI